MRPLIIAALAATAAVVALAACGVDAPIAPGTAAAAAAAQTGPLPSAARYVIELQTAGTVPTSLAAAIARDGGTVIRSHAGTGLILVGGLSAQAATALRARSDVRVIVPDIARRVIQSNRPFRILSLPLAARARLGASSQGRAYPSGDPHNATFYAQNEQWNMAAVHADSAWEVTSRGTGAAVYILDSGVDTAHIEFKGGRIDLPLSTSFAYAASDTLQQNPLPFGHDVVGHGTFVSGIVTTNGINLASVAPKARVVMVRVIDDSGSAGLFSILDGILYAADEGARVVNMSFGGYIPRDESIGLTTVDLYERVLTYAYQRGTLLVAAAGNDGLNTNTATAPTGSYADSTNSPAGLPHVLSVGATAPLNQQNPYRIASYSNYGEAGVAVFAPGGDSVAGSSQLDLLIGPCSALLFTQCASENQYVIDDGTSFASPHAAAEAAVVLAQSGFSFGSATLEACELASASEVTGVRRDVNYGYGVINVLHAATACESPWRFVP